MSMPSDVTPDIAEAVERMERPMRIARQTSQFTPEQRGFALAAFVAFLGIAFVGPAIGRVLRPDRSTAKKVTRGAKALRGRAINAGKRIEKRVRRLGGGSFRR